MSVNLNQYQPQFYTYCEQKYCKQQDDFELKRSFSTVDIFQINLFS